LIWRDLFEIRGEPPSAGCLTESRRASNTLTAIGRDFVLAHIIPNSGLAVSWPKTSPSDAWWICRHITEAVVRRGRSRSILKSVNPGLHRFSGNAPGG
jgi:hypothetical protein